ncbi:MAG: hypothetical protein ACJAYY_002002 [Paraglaciecola sp.]|jgi:hypothetical protein
MIEAVNWSLNSKYIPKQHKRAVISNEITALKMNLCRFID